MRRMWFVMPVALTGEGAWKLHMGGPMPGKAPKRKR
jgi:hypothetical protein